GEMREDVGVAVDGDEKPAGMEFESELIIGEWFPGNGVVVEQAHAVVVGLSGGGKIPGGKVRISGNDFYAHALFGQAPERAELAPFPPVEQIKMTRVLVTEDKADEVIVVVGNDHPVPLDLGVLKSERAEKNGGVRVGDLQGHGVALEQCPTRRG